MRLIPRPRLSVIQRRPSALTVLVLGATFTPAALQADSMLAADTVVLYERLAVYDPVDGSYQGAEERWFGPDGRRLRWMNTDAEGSPTLVFFALHDDQGRESEAMYYQEDPEDLTRELFTYSDDGRVRTTTYYYEPGVAADRVDVDLDESGRELAKRYFRADGTQYGEEDVLWNERGDQVGWDFRRVGGEGRASFRYEYTDFDDQGRWTRRVRSRDGEPERVEVRTLSLLEDPQPHSRAR